MKYAQVYIDTNTVAIDQIFDYIVPEKFEDVIAPAMRVIVPFGKGNKVVRLLWFVLPKKRNMITIN